MDKIAIRYLSKKFIVSIGSYFSFEGILRTDNERYPRPY